MHAMIGKRVNIRAASRTFSRLCGSCEQLELDKDEQHRGHLVKKNIRSLNSHFEEHEYDSEDSRNELP